MPTKTSGVQHVPKRVSCAAMKAMKKQTTKKHTTKSDMKKLVSKSKRAGRRPLDGLANVTDSWLCDVMAEWLVIKDWNTAKSCRFMRLLRFVDECLTHDF